MLDMPAAIARQRREIAATLAGLNEEQWETQSCCAEWSVLEVAAHLTYGWNFSLLTNSLNMLKTGGNLDKVSAGYIRQLKTKGGAAIAADMAANADHRFKPPGLGFDAPLNDLVLHRRDMFLPLGIEYEVDEELLALVLDKSTARGMFGMVNSQGALKGLSFTATDMDWTHGDGPEVSGPGIVLSHAMWGRAESLPELTGDGVAILGSRLS